MTPSRDGYRCIMADPAWQPRDRLPGPTRGSERNYRVMSTDEIAGLLDSSGFKAATNAILFLWRLASMQEDALRVASAWGFRVLSEVVWCKQTKNGLPWFGMGRTVRAAHETALICVRGSASGIVTGRDVRSVFSAPVPTYEVGHHDIGRVLLDEDKKPIVDSRGRSRAIRVGDYIHSAKPDKFLTEVVYPLIGDTGPNVELFARQRRLGWDAHGDELPPQ